MRTLFIILLVALTGCKPGDNAPAQIEPPCIVLPDTIRLLAPTAAKTLLDSQPRLQVIDCRMNDEFLHGRLPGAYHVNFFDLEDTRQRLQTLDRSRPSLVYCSLGTRSGHTALLMLELGFNDITILDGGIHAWLSAGLPLVR